MTAWQAAEKMAKDLNLKTKIGIGEPQFNPRSRFVRLPFAFRESTDDRDICAATHEIGHASQRIPSILFHTTFFRAFAEIDASRRAAKWLKKNAPSVNLSHLAEAAKTYHPNFILKYWLKVAINTTP